MARTITLSSGRTVTIGGSSNTETAPQTVTAKPAVKLTDTGTKSGLGTANPTGLTRDAFEKQKAAGNVTVSQDNNGNTVTTYNTGDKTVISNGKTTTTLTRIETADGTAPTYQQVQNYTLNNYGLTVEQTGKYTEQYQAETDRYTDEYKQFLASGHGSDADRAKVAAAEARANDYAYIDGRLKSNLQTQQSWGENLDGTVHNMVGNSGSSQTYFDMYNESLKFKTTNQGNINAGASVTIPGEGVTLTKDYIEGYGQIYRDEAGNLYPVNAGNTDLIQKAANEYTYPASEKANLDTVNPANVVKNVSPASPQEITTAAPGNQTGFISGIISGIKSAWGNLFNKDAGLTPQKSLSDITAADVLETAVKTNTEINKTTVKTTDTGISNYVTAVDNAPLPLQLAAYVATPVSTLRFMHKGANAPETIDVHDILGLTMDAATVVAPAAKLLGTGKLVSGLARGSGYTALGAGVADITSSLIPAIAAAAPADGETTVLTNAGKVNPQYTGFNVPSKQPETQKPLSDEMPAVRYFRQLMGGRE